MPAMPTAWGWPSRFRTISWTWWVMRPPGQAHRFRRQGDKTTFVALKGLADCRILVAELTDRAVEALAPFGSEAESLRGLAAVAGRPREMRGLI